jgi:hypothetical protein
MKVFLRALVVLAVALVCFLAVRHVSAQGGGVSITQTFCLSGTPAFRLITMTTTVTV